MVHLVDILYIYDMHSIDAIYEFVKRENQKIWGK